MGKMFEAYQFIKMRDIDKKVLNAITITYFLPRNRSSKSDLVMDQYFIDVALSCRDVVYLKYENETLRDMDFNRLIQLLNADTGE